MKHVKLVILGVSLLILLQSCALLNPNRMHNHKGIDQNDFGLPTVLYPAAPATSKSLVILLSGDGGWIEFEDNLATELAGNGFHTIGFNSRSYFWKSKTPEETKNTITKLIRKYASLYHTEKIYLIGYSFGADVLPFIYNRFPPFLKRRVVSLTMLSPYATTDFKVHLSDLISIAPDNRSYSVKSEVSKVASPVFCFYGEEEKEKALEDLKQTNFNLHLLNGNHRYDADAIEKIISTIKK